MCPNRSYSSLAKLSKYSLRPNTNHETVSARDLSLIASFRVQIGAPLMPRARHADKAICDLVGQEELNILVSRKGKAKRQKIAGGIIRFSRFE